MKILTVTTLAAMSLAALTTSVFAGGPAAGPGPMGMGRMGGPAQMFEQADTNKDGKLDAAEIAAANDKAFAAANSDGKDGVTIQEFEPYFWKQHHEMMVRAFQFLDADGDGQVSKDEMDAASERMLTRFDRNDDGSISPDDRAGPGWGRDGKEGRRHHGQGMMQRWMGGQSAPAEDDAPAAVPTP